MKIGLVEKLLVKACEKRSITKKQLVSSYVSLFLTFTIIITTTFAWFTTKDTATLSTSSITMNGTSGLRVNNGEDLTGTVALPSNVVLSEASSIDGRNMFFPTTGSFDDQTENMVFREGTVSDKNFSYYYKTFQLSSDSGATDVYIKDYHVQIGDIKYSSNLAGGSDEVVPLRIALIKDSSTTPIVIDPSAALPEYVHQYKAVSTTDTQGTPQVAVSNSTSFADYYYATGNPIFSLNENETVDVTAVIWLEGGNLITNGVETENNLDKYIGKNISLDINFESNWDYMDIIRFVDNTIGDDGKVESGHWVTDDNCLVTLTYLDQKTQEYKTINMTMSSNYANDRTWTAALPQSLITNIRFNRYNPKKNEIWNAWYTEPGVNELYSDQIRKGLQESRVVEKDGVKYRCLTYWALQGNGCGTEVSKRMYPCKGYWQVDDYSVKIEDLQIPTTPTEKPTEKPTPKPTDPPITNYKVEVSCKDPGAWAGGKLYIVFEDDREVEIKFDNNNYYKSTGVEVNTGDKIVKLKNANSDTISVSHSITSTNIRNNINIEIYHDGSGANIGN